MRARYTILAGVCVLFAGLAAAPAGAWHSNRGIKGSGDMETRELDLDRFETIELGGAFEVDIRFGKNQHVEVTIDDNLWDNLETDVRHGDLEVGWDERCRPSDDCRIEIVVKELTKMDISGACDVSIHGFDGKRFSFQLSGAAELEMDGSVEDLNIQVSGAGEIDTRELKAKRATVRISGAGNADVYASESFDGRVSGVGNIDYWGNPDREKTSTSGLGNIKRR